VANYLKMMKRQQVLAFLELGWTYRRIESETGVRRETVSRYDRARRSNAAKVFPGSGGLEAAESMASDSNAAKVFAGSKDNRSTIGVRGFGAGRVLTAADRRRRGLSRAAV